MQAVRVNQIDYERAILRGEEQEVWTDDSILLGLLIGVVSENGKQSTPRLLADHRLREALLRRRRSVAPMWLGGSRKPFSVQTDPSDEFQERWAVASGKNRVRAESGRAMKP